MHHSATNIYTCVNSWAPSHQTNSNMQKYPSKTTYKYHFPTTLGNCGSRPYKHQGQGLPQCSQQRLSKRTCQRNPWGKVGNSKHVHSYQTALGSGQHSGLNKINKLPNDHPQASDGPDKTSALISTDQPHNWNIDEAPQNSSTGPAKT